MVDSNAVGLRIVFCVYDFHDCYPFVFVLEVKVHGLILDLMWAYFIFWTYDFEPCALWFGFFRCFCRSSYIGCCHILLVLVLHHIHHFLMFVWIQVGVGA